MEYMILINGDESQMKTMTPDQGKEMHVAYMAYSEALQKAGIIRGGARLHPTDMGTRVRVRDGKSEVLNGPFAETKEQLGGYYTIDVPDLDAALSWAARCPGASRGSVEVRPVWVM
jgi:hypothetical protein